MKRLGILLLALLLAGCQPTPAADAVRQKNSARMIEMARGEATVTSQAGETGPAATAVPVKALAPVWVFLKADRPNDQQQKLWAQLGQTPATPNYDTLNPLVMINAVDGTVIDPYAGY